MGRTRLGGRERESEVVCVCVCVSVIESEREMEGEGEGGSSTGTCWGGPGSPGARGHRGGDAFIPHKVFSTSFCKSQLIHKPVYLIL